MSSENLLSRLIIGATLFCCVYLLLGLYLPDEDTKTPSTYANRWIYHTNNSCEVKPNGYFAFITDNKKFWMHTSGSMENWRKEWVAENPYQRCSKEYQITDEQSLRCKVQVQEMDDRWKRCYPIVTFKCKEAGYLCN